MASPVVAAASNKLYNREEKNPGKLGKHLGVSAFTSTSTIGLSEKCRQCIVLANMPVNLDSYD